MNHFEKNVEKTKSREIEITNSKRDFRTGLSKKKGKVSPINSYLWTILSYNYT